MHDYKYKEVLLSAFLNVKLWLKKGDYQILKYSLDSFIRCKKVLISFSHYFIFNIARLVVIPIYLESTIIRLLISQICTVLSPLGVQFFSLLEIETKKAFSHKACKIKSYLELQNSNWMKKSDLWSRNCIGSHLI